MPAKFRDYAKQWHRAEFYENYEHAAIRMAELKPKFNGVKISPSTKNYGKKKGFQVWFK